MTDNKTESNAKKKEQVRDIKNKEDGEWLHFKAGRELRKSELPGVVETASLGEIKKPKPSKRP
ncbi:MAG: hypothetical protein O8C62_06050 [Candidatus Methanoperedens sp.]|nr:hypothetical protein [Candidatus Methanoperedens sp.]